MIPIENERVLIAVPCFNEMESLRQSVKEIIEVKCQMTKTDLIVIDDGSTDKSIESITDLDVLVLRHPTNMGLGESFKSAMEFMLIEGYDFLVTIDADGQFLPSEIPALLNRIKESNWGLVTGSRFLADSNIENMPKARIFGNKVYVLILQALSLTKISDVSCGFRVYSRDALLNLNIKNSFTYTHETIMQLTQAQIPMTDIPITVKYFKNRKSKISGNRVKYGFRTLKIISKTTFILKPVQAFLCLALFFSVPGAYFGYIFIQNKIQTGSFQGYLYAGITSGFLFILFLLASMFAGISAVLIESNRKLGKILYLAKSSRYGK